MRNVTIVTWKDKDDVIRHDKFDSGGYNQPLYHGTIHLASLPEKAAAEFVRGLLEDGLVDTLFINQYNK